MSNSSEILVSSLPNPLPSNGLFTVASNIPAGSFSDPSANNSTYSNWILNPADLIGTSSAPYAPVALPAYVSTLYQNVFNINNSLQESIADAAVDDRHFPTSYAVQKYVQSQLSGCQILSANDPDNNENIVSTTVTNTLIETVSSNASQYSYSYVAPGASSAIVAEVALYEMDTGVNATRNGASKIVVFGDSSYASAVNGNLMFLYAGDNSSFVVAGHKQKYYQFTFQGDFVQFVNVYDSVTSSWLWLVTNYQSVFSNAMNVTGLTKIN